MFIKIRNKIERNRNSRNLGWKILVFVKDCLWELLNIIIILTNKKINFCIEPLIKNKVLKNKKLKILYIYDFKDWAIHNVGKIWLTEIKEINIKFTSVREAKINEFKNYDYVWFGYIDLYKPFMYNPSRSIVTVHDPMEFYSEIKDWKNKILVFTKKGVSSFFLRKNKIRILKRLKYLVTTSKEMKKFLNGHGLNPYLIPTMSDLPLRNKKEIITKKCDLCSIFNSYPRKNPKLMNSLKEDSEKNFGLKFDLKLGMNTLSEKDYKKFIDKHEIYVCTSYQEGGPIPAMDAMNRGAVVLTTPVGQIQEIIKNNENGFICIKKQDFIEKISLLSNNLELLHKMRIKSRESIERERNKQDIKNSVLSFLKKSLSNNLEANL